MEQINLLPEAVRQRAARQKLVPYVAIAVLVGIAAVGAGWFILKANVSNLNEQVAKRERDLDEAATATATKNQEQQTASQTTNALSTRVQILNQLASQEVDWSKTFLFLGSVIPKDITVNGASYVTTDTGMKITITGKAPSSLSFANFVESLRLSDKLNKQNVDSFTLDTKDGSVSYSITLDVKADNVRYQTAATKGGS